MAPLWPLARLQRLARAFGTSLAAASRAPAPEALVSGILEGDRLAISRAITLAESSRPEHQVQAAALLRLLQERRGAVAQSDQPDGASFRIGVTGPPGAGKSSVIEALGCAMHAAGQRVAVLAIDPSSEWSGGAILGDKTRMSRLSSLEDAFVRPTPARGTLGGVARATADAVSICEAAGYERILIETVGVGQSETAVVDLVDCTVLVAPPVGGDELQTIKRGINEVVDVVAVNKADGPTRLAAAQAAASFRGTISFHRQRRRSWVPAVLTCSAHTGTGVEALREKLEECRSILSESGELSEVRRQQRSKLVWAATEELELDNLRRSPWVRECFDQLRPYVSSGEVAPRVAAELMSACNSDHR